MRKQKRRAAAGRRRRPNPKCHGAKRSIPLGSTKEKDSRRAVFFFGDPRRGENPRFEHEDFFCTSKSAAQRRDGTAGQIRSVTERSGVSPLGPPKKKAAERLSFSLVELRRGENPRFEHKDFFCASKSAAQRRVGTAGKIRSVTERSGVSPLGGTKAKSEPHLLDRRWVRILLHLLFCIAGLLLFAK